MYFPTIRPEIEIKKGDRVLMQRTKNNTARVLEYMDMQWATVRGFNTHRNMIIWFTKEDGDCNRWSKRRVIQREDIISVERS